MPDLLARLAEITKTKGRPGIIAIKGARDDVQHGGERSQGADYLNRKDVVLRTWETEVKKDVLGTRETEKNPTGI